MIRGYNLWFYILSDGTLRAWQNAPSGDYAADPVVAHLSTAVYADPGLLHHALSTGDATLYALQQQYQWYYDGSYYQDAGVAGSRWFRSTVPAAMLPVVPFSQPALVGGRWGRVQQPVFTKGAAGAWDGLSCYNPRIVKQWDGSPYRDSSGTYYMLYCASSVADPERDQSGLASAPSLGGPWTRVLTTPLIARGSTYDAGDAQVESVVWDGSNFHLWYDANSALSGGDQDSIAYASGASLVALEKHGVVVQSAIGEDYYGAQVFRAPEGGFGMLAVRHIGATYGVVRLDSASIAGPWVERTGWAFTHSSGTAYCTSVRVVGGSIRMLYDAADYSTVREAYAVPGGPLTALGDVLPTVDGFGYSPYGCDSVWEAGVEHLFYTAQPYTGGIGHAFAPMGAA